MSVVMGIGSFECEPVKATLRERGGAELLTSEIGSADTMAALLAVASFRDTKRYTPIARTSV
jgi:hypothetical protein